MAILKVVDEGRVMSDEEDVRQYLAGAGIEYGRWNVSSTIGRHSDEEAILAAYADQIARLRLAGQYTKVDVIDVDSSTPGLDGMLSKFSAEHWHDEDEMRFTVFGRGLYHVHPTNGAVVSLEVEPGDIVRVPRGTLHWFDLCGNREIKAIRFFQDPSGWTPYYSKSSIEDRYQPVCFGSSSISLERIVVDTWLGQK